MLDELKGLPLVSRRDSALRPISYILSEDIWLISQAIESNCPIPRTLFRNGKRSRQFLAAAPRHAPKQKALPDPIISLSGTLNITASSEHQNPSQDNVSSQTRDVTSLSSSQSCTMLSQTIINPSPTHPSDSQTSTSSPSLPSRGKFSERIITRDLNSLRQDVRTIKVEINSLRRQSTPATPGEFQLEVCHELKVLKQELAHLRESMYTRHAECQNQNQIQNLPSTQP